MKVLYQEVDELEARLALHGERQVRECRVAVRCEADILKASHEAQMTEAQDELTYLQRQVAERELSLKKNSRRLLDMQLQIQKKCHIPNKQDRLAAEQEHEMACAAIVQSEVAVQEEHEAECAILKRKLDQHDMAHSELQQSLAEAGQKQLELFQEAQDKSSLEALACELAQQLELCREWTGNLEAALSFMQSTASTSVEELHQLDQQNECLVQDTTVSVSACQGHSLKEERELSSAELQELLQADDTHVLDKQLQEAEQCRMKLEETVAALRHDALQLQASVALHRATKELQEELASALERKEATTRSGDELLVEIRQWGHKVRPEDSAFRDSRHPPSSPVQKGEHNLSLESLEHEVQVAEEALLEDLSAKLAAREKRVQFLASRWLHRRLGSPASNG